jgi:hypothetical protein
MYRKAIVILVLCFSAWIIMEGISAAACTKTSSGWVCKSPMCADSSWVGVGNPEVNELVICVSLAFECTGNCVNKKGNAATAEGVPFEPQIEEAAVAMIEAFMLDSERGRAFLEGTHCFDSDDLLYDIGEWVDEHFLEFCPNKNWTFIWELNRIWTYYSAIRKVKELDENGEWTGSFIWVIEGDGCSLCEVGALGASGDCGLSCNDLSESGACRDRGLGGQCLEKVAGEF